MADDQIPASPTPPAAPDTTTPPPDFSAIPGHADHSQAATLSDHPIWQRLKDAFEMPNEAYTQKYAGDDAALHTKVNQVMSHVIPFFKEATEAQPAIEKTQLGKQTGEFVQSQLQHPEQLAMGGEFGGEAAPEALLGGAKTALEGVAETGKTFAKTAAGEGKAAVTAKHPAGSLEAGFAKIPGYQKISDFPEMPNPHMNYAGSRYGRTDAEQNYQNPDLYKEESELGRAYKTAWDKADAIRQAKIDAENPSIRVEPEKTPNGNISESQRAVTPESSRTGTQKTVEDAGGIFRHSKNGLTEVTLPRSMTDKLPLADHMKDWVSVTIPDEEVTPENVKARMEQKFKDFGGKTEETPKTAPNDQIANSAQRYNSARGHAEIDHAPQELPAQEERNASADQYDRAQHEPNNPAVKRSYDAMKKETLDQFNHAKNDLGIKFDFTKEDPYKTAEEMQKDVRENHHLATYTEGTPLAKDHPLAEVEPTTGQTYNNIFRATHDIFGHAAGGHDFSEAGEENAYRAHKQMYSPEAAPAVQNETQGQANWYFNNARARAGAEKDFPEQKATIIPETGKAETEPEEDTSFEFGANAPSESGYHPTLQKIADKYGVTEDPYAIRNGASFITPDGKYIHLGSIEHGAAIHEASGTSERPEFLNDTGAIRTRVSFDKGGHTLHVSVPADGVSKEQVDALKQAAAKSVGKGGRIVMERADVTPETKDTLTHEEWSGNANNIEPMLHKIQAHPEDKWHAIAGKKAATESAGGIDPRTGKSDTEGIGTEIFPEKRQALDHAPTSEDFKNFHEQNQELFDKHPELKIGWDNNSNVPGGHEINIAATGKGAARVAKKLDQRAAFDIGKGEEIPTGGQGLRSEFPNYPMEERIKDLKGEPQSNIPGFESLSKDFHANMEPDERAYLKDNNLLQSNAMKQYHSITPSVPETINAMQAGAALGGWWQRYIDVFHGLADGGEQAAQVMGPSHAEVLKQWHAAVSGNKSVQDANNMAWHSYADWLEAGKPTDRESIDRIVRKNGAQPQSATAGAYPKKGNAAISDVRTKSGKLKTPGLDTTKLYNLVNSPEMKGERPFSGQVFNEEQKNPLMGTTEGARKIPSMGATVAGKGNLNRLVIDAHIRDFYGHKSSGGPAAQYIADSVHLRQAAKALGLKGGEGQEQLWGTVLGLKQLLKEGLTPEETAGKLNSDVINSIGKDYAEVIANDPEITKPGGVLDRLKQLGIGRGSAGVSEAYSPARSASAGQSGPPASQATVDPALLSKTAQRIRGQISESKIKKPAATAKPKPEGLSEGWMKLITGEGAPKAK